MSSEGRCRLCTTNDVDALAAEVAEEMWNTHRDRQIDADWEHAGPYWHAVITGYAEAMIKVLHRRHG